MIKYKGEILRIHRNKTFIQKYKNKIGGKSIMMKSMYSGVAGLKSHQTKMDVIGNNIANVNTTGFKAQRAIFTDVIYQKLASASAPTDDGAGGTNPQQIGLGVSVSTIDTDFNSGSPQSTGYGLDLCLSGDGFFMLKESEDSEEIVYTRLGNFKLDANSNLVNGSGYMVLSSDQDSINCEGYTNVSVDKKGVIRGINDSGEEEEIAVIGVANFVNPGGLEKLGNSNYKETANSGEVLTEGDLVVGENGTGEIVPGYLEMSNVDLAREFTEMITTQRGYQANSRVITVSDTMLEELINLKR